MPPAETAEPDVGYGTAQLVAATPGATVDASRGEAGRTSEEKVDALNKATEKTADVEGFKTMHELAAGSTAEMQACLQQIVYVLERHFNIDFVREAPLVEVTAGIAHQRAAMAPFGESPELVDDVVVPPGVNNAGDEVLPTNILAGSSEDTWTENAGPIDPDAAPAKSASREEWDTYARSIGVNPDDYSSKEELQSAVDARQSETAQS